MARHDEGNKYDGENVTEGTLLQIQVVGILLDAVHHDL